MPEGVIYQSRDAAEAYADEVGGVVREEDSDGDGVIDGFMVEVVSSPFRGPNPDELEGEAAQDQAAYLRALAGANVDAVGEGMGRGIKEFMDTAVAPPDEEGLGYMRHGGMKFKKRGSVKYSKGGAVKGKGFAGSF